MSGQELKENLKIPRENDGFVMTLEGQVQLTEKVRDLALFLVNLMPAPQAPSPILLECVLMWWIKEVVRL